MTLGAKLERLEVDYLTCERENTNLRNILQWAALKLGREDLEQLEQKLRPPIEDGGITPDGGYEDLKATLKDAALFDEVAEHLELLDRPPGERLPKGWANIALRLANRCREAGPKNPVVMRLQNMPNVLHIIRSPV